MFLILLYVQLNSINYAFDFPYSVLEVRLIDSIVNFVNLFQDKVVRLMVEKKILPYKNCKILCKVLLLIFVTLEVILSVLLVKNYAIKSRI